MINIGPHEETTIPEAIGCLIQELRNTPKNENSYRILNSLSFSIHQNRDYKISVVMNATIKVRSSVEIPDLYSM